jgi:hypothetical protein
MEECLNITHIKADTPPWVEKGRKSVKICKKKKGKIEDRFILHRGRGGMEEFKQYAVHSTRMYV